MPWFAEPRVEYRADDVEDRADGLRFHLHEVEVFGIARGRVQDEFVQRSAAAKQHVR